jgi:hypothetical protein
VLDLPPADAGEWVEVGSACATENGTESDQATLIAHAREFVSVGERVSGPRWHHEQLWQVCRLTGQVIVDDEVWRFEAGLNGDGWVQRTGDGAESKVLCYDCEAWTAPAECRGAAC